MIQFATSICILVEIRNFCNDVTSLLDEYFLLALYGTIIQ
jgi:hypothetical protein